MTHTHGKKIAVIIPCFNVSKHIEGVIRTIPSFVEKIIVVDDLSKDKTTETVERLADRRVLLLRHEKNQGVGGAMLTGYRRALELGMDIFVKMDGDGQMKPECLESLIKPLLENEADYAKGNRFNDFSALKCMPAHRRVGNAFHSFFTKLVSGYWNIFDATNGYTALTAGCFKKLDTNKISRRYFFETGILIELNIVGAVIKDVEMPSIYGDEKSHMKIHRVLFTFPFLLLKGFARRFFARYLMRDFNVLSLCVLTGLPLFLFGVGYGFYIWIHPPRIGEPTPAGTVMIAALPIIMGFQLLLAGLILDVLFVPSKRKS